MKVTQQTRMDILSGVKGVRKLPSGNWLANIQVNRKHVRIGTFNTLKQAVEARASAENKYYGEFARG